MVRCDIDAKSGVGEPYLVFDTMNAIFVMSIPVDVNTMDYVYPDDTSTLGLS
jgi:hypothetical protein